jgi:outer membrane receptor protein involved in Fe transport
VYAQDDWTPTPRLVLNLGVRWDIETNMINNSYVTPQALADSLRGPLNSLLFAPQPQPSGPAVNVRVIDRLGGLDRFITRGREDRPIYKGAIQPRLGASYDLRGNGQTVLFGGGGVYYDRNYWNTLFDEAFRRQFRQGLRGCFQPQYGCISVGPWNDRYFEPAQLRTLSYATAPEVFMVANDLKPPKTYQFSGGVRQAVWSGLLTVSYNAIRGYNGMNFVRGSNALPPNYAAVFVTDDRVKTWYNAMQLQFNRPLRQGMRWGGALAYTLSRSEEQGQSTDLFWGFNSRYPTVADLPRRRAPGDQTHNIVTNAIVRVPFGMLFSTIVNLGSGILVNGTDASAGFGQYQQVPFVFQPPTRAFLGVGKVFANQNLDLRLEKFFRLVQGQQVSLSADLYNALNSRNYGCFNTTINPTSGSPNANYGVPGCAALGRRLQVGLRYGLAPARTQSAPLPGQ